MARRSLYFLILGMVIAHPILAWDDCPFGLVNDRYPGKCGLYVDTNNDSICDHSQKSPSLLALAQDTIVSVTTSPEQLKQVSARATLGTKKFSPMPAAPVIKDQATSDILAPAPRPTSPLRQRYPLWQVFVIVLVLAVTTEILIKSNKRLTLPLQAAWNWALGLSFLVTFASSLVYVYPALLVKVNFNMSYWHSLPGLVMIAAGLYHLIRRFGSMWRGLFAWFRAIDPGRRENS